MLEGMRLRVKVCITEIIEDIAVPLSAFNDFNFFFFSVLGPDGQPRFPRTVPRSGSIPLMRNNDPQSPNGGVVRPLEPATMPRQFAAPPDQQPQNIVFNDR
jgi:hypothetical protein